MSLQEEKAKAEALFTSVGEGIITTDEKGYVTRANQVALEILGMSKRQLIGKWFTETVVAVDDNGEAVDKLERPITRSFLTGEAIRTRTNYLTKSGRIVPVAITVSPIMLRGKPIGAVEIFRDITAELHDDRMKANFISLASHQLRTPLTSIRLYSQMLQDGFAGEITKQQAEFLETIVSSTTIMNNLINTLLNISRIESGTVSIRPQKVNLNELIEQVHEQFIPEADARGHKLALKLPKEGVYAQTDPVLLREIYANFVSNAIKYTPEKGTVAIQLKRDKVNSRNIFCVSDTGYGIPEGDQKSLFSKFFRAENITSKDTTGTGLGLYLVKTLSEHLGGEVWFKSQEDKGSTFYFALPCAGTPERAGSYNLQTERIA
jgi:two-component system sensor histidine kinase VicK